jgi:N-methylhydantoinase A/oxoprolinase/acetone carboxylase beta subunit
MHIGVDVGGTNTDAVLMDGSRLVSMAKLPTTPDITSGIVAALQNVLPDGGGKGKIDAVMVGTTHFTNALLEHRGLLPTAIVRLALPATKLLPPLVDWPQDLRQAIGGFAYMAQGGYEFDGREIAPLDVKELKTIAKDIVSHGVRAVAICGVFSPVNSTQEITAAEIIAEYAPDVRIGLSYENGRIGILERENAAVLNACLGGVAEQTIWGIQQAINSLGLNAKLYLSQNDGTLMDSQFASRFPVLTISSGPTNSIRGAAYLSGVKDGIVVDVGGTSTDVGALMKGYPQEAAMAVAIAGVRTNFRMPDVLSIPLGGGSIVKEDPLAIGPQSVGYRLTEDSKVFGGGTLTTTDIAVAAGLADIGNPDRVRYLSDSFIQGAREEIQNRMERAIDLVKLRADSVPIVLVGGGSILVGEKLAGASQVIRPDYADVANAIGAAIAQVGGQVDKLYSLEKIGRLEAMDAARQEAIGNAVAAGAHPSTVEVVEIDEVPLTYLPGNATRIRVKAIGDLTPE